MGGGFGQRIRDAIPGRGGPADDGEGIRFADIVRPRVDHADRGAEKGGAAAGDAFDDAVAALDLTEGPAASRAPETPGRMAHGVVFEGMSRFDDAPGEIGQGFDLMADAEERCAGVVLLEQGEDGGRVMRIRAVIDREPDLPPVGAEPVGDRAEPVGVREEGGSESGEVPGRSDRESRAETAGRKKGQEAQRESEELRLGEEPAARERFRFRNFHSFGIRASIPKNKRVCVPARSRLSRR